MPFCYFFSLTRLWMFDTRYWNSASLSATVSRPRQRERAMSRHWRPPDVVRRSDWWKQGSRRWWKPPQTKATQQLLPLPLLPSPPALLPLLVLPLILLLLLAPPAWSAINNGAAPCRPGLTNCSCTEQGDEVIVVCTDLSTHLVPHMLHPRLSRLEIINSRISSLSNIDVYSSMVHLDLSGNNLSSLGEPLTKLQKLRSIVVRMNKLTAIRKMDLKGLSSLQSLDASQNQILTIEATAFEGTALLSWLDLSRNKLTAIDKVSFKGLSKLQWLNLRTNKFHKIPAALTSLKSLTHLDLSENPLQAVPAGSVSLVQSLILERCGLTNSSFLLANSSIVSVDLSFNRFTNVPRSLPADLSSLRLDGNPIRTLSSDSLTHLSNLRNFSMSNCSELRAVNVGTFATNSRLRQVALDDNPALTSLDSQVFAELEELEHVSLRRNGLQSVGGEGPTVTWHTLKRLDLRDNPFRCDCSLKWLWELAVAFKNNSQSSENRLPPFDTETILITCAEPASFKGVAIYDVPAATFRCRPTSRLLALGVVAISLVLVACLAALVYALLRCGPRRWPAWLPKVFDKTAPVASASSKIHHQEEFFEKTYMIPGDDYQDDTRYHRNAPVRLIPVTEL